jgi:hypothetical protein
MFDSRLRAPQPKKNWLLYLKMPQKMTARTPYFIIQQHVPSPSAIKALKPPNRGTRKSGSGRNGGCNKNNLTENNEKCRHFGTTQEKEKHKLRYTQGSVRKPVIVAKHGEIPTSMEEVQTPKPVTNKVHKGKPTYRDF